MCPVLIVILRIGPRLRLNVTVHVRIAPGIFSPLNANIIRRTNCDIRYAITRIFIRCNLGALPSCPITIKVKSSNLSQNVCATLTAIIGLRIIRPLVPVAVAPLVAKPAAIRILIMRIRRSDRLVTHGPCVNIFDRSTNHVASCCIVEGCLNQILPIPPSACFRNKLCIVI